MLSVIGTDGQGHLVNRVFHRDSIVKSDSAALVIWLADRIDSLRSHGYLAASVDKIYPVDNETLKAEVHLGKRYFWGSLDVSGINSDLLRGTQSAMRNFASQPVEYGELGIFLASILANAENHGYPFARLSLTNLVERGDTLFASLDVTPGPEIRIDSLIVRGEARLNPEMLAEHLDIASGTLFSREKLLDIPRKIRELPYITLSGNPEIRFLRDRARVILTLKRRNASKFDFLLGVLPRREAGSAAVITGSFLADMHNQFALGEQLYIHFERLRPRTQNLEIRTDFPYLPVIPFGIEGSFDLFKNDTLYTQLKWRAGILYPLNRRTQLRAFLDWHNSNLISIRKQQLIQSNALPENLDIRVKGVGFGLRYRDLDYVFNPRSGPDVSVSAVASLRRIQRNNEILALEDENPGFKADSLYNAIDPRTEQYKIQVDAAYYLPIGVRGAVKLGCRAAALLATDDILGNELYRIGGVHILRGFDEESLFVDRYLVLTGEYRLLLSQNSYLAVFSDVALTKNATLEPAFSDIPFGFGAGINFETNAGIFGLSVAYGTQKNVPVNLRAAKVHFGYVNVF